MIFTFQFLYKFDLKLNKKASNEHQSIPLEDKILALNEAQIQLIKKKLGTNNIYGLGLDSFKKRYEDLQDLIVQFEPLNVTATADAYSAYQADVNMLHNKFMFPLDMYATCSRGNCRNRIVYLSKLVKHGDISTLMFNTHYAPSFEWQETFAVMSSDKIITYTDGTFVVDKFNISYIRYPKKIDAAGYINFDGTASIDQNCELADYLEDELLDLAILELALDTENTPVVQANEIRNKNNE
jgi:hypothetical protein